MVNDTLGVRMQVARIASEKVTIERKIFSLDLKENQRGRFLKITEDVDAAALTYAQIGDDVIKAAFNNFATLMIALNRPARAILAS